MEDLIGSAISAFSRSQEFHCDLSRGRAIWLSDWTTGTVEYGSVDGGCGKQLSDWMKETMVGASRAGWAKAARDSEQSCRFL